jgi:hypothetical protein
LPDIWRSGSSDWADEQIFARVDPTEARNARASTVISHYFRLP